MALLKFSGILLVAGGAFVLLDRFRKRHLTFEDRENPPIAPPNLQPSVRVYFDISRAESSTVDRIVIGVYEDYVPMAASNFLSFVTSSSHGTYQGVEVVRAIPGEIIQVGSPVMADERKVTIYGGLFKDEVRGLGMKHERGTVGYANLGREDTNGSQFYVALCESPWLDRKHVVFGRVESGMDILDDAARTIHTERDVVYKKPFHIVRSGLLPSQSGEPTEEEAGTRSQGGVS